MEKHVRLFAVFMSAIITYVTSTYAGIFISGAIASEKMKWH